MNLRSWKRPLFSAPVGRHVQNSSLADAAPRFEGTYDHRLRRTTGVLASLLNRPDDGPDAKRKTVQVVLRHVGQIFDATTVKFRRARPGPDGDGQDDGIVDTEVWSRDEGEGDEAMWLSIPVSGSPYVLHVGHDHPHQIWHSCDVALMTVTATFLHRFLTTSSSSADAPTGQEAPSFDASTNSSVPTPNDSVTSQHSLYDALTFLLKTAEQRGDLSTPMSVFGPDGTVVYPRRGPLASVLRQPGGRSALAGAVEDRSTGVILPGGMALRIEWIYDGNGDVLGGFGWPDASKSARSSLSEDARFRQRMQAERALVEASQLLVAATGSLDYDDLLRIVGEATAARYAYLVVISPDDVADATAGDGSEWAYTSGHTIHPDTYAQYEWFAPWSGPRRAETSDAQDGATFAVPILSPDDQLFGYIGIEYDADVALCRDEDTRVLSVLGDMLCAYLQRQVSEAALRRSEQRYRHFVDTTSEAIWRIECDPPIRTDQPVSNQVQALRTRGVVVECNRAMTKLLGLPADDLLGISLDDIVDTLGDDLVRDLVNASYRLRQFEYVAPGDRQRYFVLNTVGVQSGGLLTGIWGGVTELTERVELERRMVSSLEKQQQRIGRDLHDRVGQQLAGTRMLAQNLADRLESLDDEEGLRSIQKIINYVQEATQHVNDLQRGVMPVQVDRDGLAQALTELASRTDQIDGVECVFLHDRRTDVEVHEVKLQLYRIAQEATRNAVTHGDPSFVELSLRRNDHAIILTIDDDGTGFDLAAQEERKVSFGLHSMRYRARSIGATLDIRTTPGDGTTVRCTLPLDRATA